MKNGLFFAKSILSLWKYFINTFQYLISASRPAKGLFVFINNIIFFIPSETAQSLQLDRMQRDLTSQLLPHDPPADRNALPEAAHPLYAQGRPQAPVLQIEVNRIRCGNQL